MRTSLRFALLDPSLAFPASALDGLRYLGGKSAALLGRLLLKLLGYARLVGVQVATLGLTLERQSGLSIPGFLLLSSRR